jgi:hypothetical protein
MELTQSPSQIIFLSQAERVCDAAKLSPARVHGESGNHIQTGVTPTALFPAMPDINQLKAGVGGLPNNCLKQAPPIHGPLCEYTSV